MLPKTARNFESVPKIPNADEYEVRYASFSTIAAVQGGPTCDTVDDAAMIRFYGDRPGWDAHRAFSIAVGPSKTGPCMDELYDPNEDLFLSTALAAGGPQEYWAVLDRQLIPRAQHDGGPDRSNGYAFKACSAMAGADGCVEMGPGGDRRTKPPLTQTYTLSPSLSPTRHPQKTTTPVWTLRCWTRSWVTTTRASSSTPARRPGCSRPSRRRSSRPRRRRQGGNVEGTSTPNERSDFGSPLFFQYGMGR